MYFWLSWSAAYQYWMGAASISHIHGDVLGVGAIERGIRIRQALTVAMLDLHLPFHSDESRRLLAASTKGLVMSTPLIVH